METLVEAIQRLREVGFTDDLWAEGEGMLRCGACGELLDAHTVQTDQIVRFEGETNPGDEAILLAVTTPKGHRGLYSSAYGPDTAAEDVEVLRALARR